MTEEWTEVVGVGRLKVLEQRNINPEYNVTQNTTIVKSSNLLLSFVSMKIHGNSVQYIFKPI